MPQNQPDEHWHIDRLTGDSRIEVRLTELSALDDCKAKIKAKIKAKNVEMKFFGGLSAPEISEALGISRATVDRDWAVARVWLHREMSRAD